MSAKSVKIVKLSKSANLLHKIAKSAKSLLIKSAALTCTARDTLDRRRETGDLRKGRRAGIGRQETGDGRREAEDRRWETGDVRQEM